MTRNEKLCPKCKSWFTYMDEDKFCVKCGSMLDKNEIILEERKLKGLTPRFPQPKPFMEIKDSYPLPLKVILHIMRPVYFTFMFIISGILWFVVWAAA